MFSKLLQGFSAASKPLKTLHYGATHFDALVADDDDGHRLRRHKTGTEGFLIVSSYLLYASLLPFRPELKETLASVAQAGIGIGTLYAMPLTMEFFHYGKKGLEQAERLKALKSPQP